MTIMIVNSIVYIIPALCVIYYMHYMEILRAYGIYCCLLKTECSFLKTYSWVNLNQFAFILHHPLKSSHLHQCIQSSLWILLWCLMSKQLGLYYIRAVRIRWRITRYTIVFLHGVLLRCHSHWSTTNWYLWFVIKWVWVNVRWTLK